MAQEQTSGTAIRVMVVDDEDAICRLVIAMIADQFDMTLVGRANDGRAAVAIAQETRPDVIVMDGNMPRMNGVEATRLIMAALPGSRIIAFSAKSDTMQAMVAAGAITGIEKTRPLRELVEAIRSLGRGISGQHDR